MRINAKHLLLCVVILHVLGFIGCAAHAQVPPSTAPKVSLTWTASSGCSVSSPCVYVISRATASGSSCPVTSGTTYALIGTSNALSFTDSSPSGSVCYIAQAQTTGTTVMTSQPSLPSNAGVPLVVPIIPLAPGAPNAAATVASANELKPEIIVASMQAPGEIRARVTR